MPKRIIHYDASQLGKLRCDACDYVAPEAHAFGPHLIGLPCPTCGASLLTQKDHDATARLLRGIDRVNRIAAWFGFGTEVPTEADKAARVTVRVHDGEWTVKGKRGDHA